VRRLLPWLLAACLLPVFLAAGAWQWGRALEKEALLVEREAVLAERRAIALDQALARDDELQWVSARGRFLDAPPVLLDNQLRNGRAGVRVFRTFDAGPAQPLLLLETGWVAWPPGRAAPVLGAVPEGTLQVEGLLLAPPSQGLSIGPAASPDPAGHVLALRLDLDVLAGMLGLQRPLAKRVLRPDPSLPWGESRDLDVLTNTLPPEKHRGYAVQWWGLAAATVVITLVLSLRRSRR